MPPTMPARLTRLATVALFTAGAVAVAHAQGVGGELAKGAADTANAARSAASESVAQAGQFFKDEALNLKVVAKLQFNKQLLRERIDVKTNQGVVTLSGNVSSIELISLAGRLASEVAGVVKVNNHLQVGPPPRPDAGPAG